MANITGEFTTEAIETISQLMKKKSIAGMLLKLGDKGVIELDEKFEKGVDAWEEFITKIESYNEKECRFGVFEIEYTAYTDANSGTVAKKSAPLVLLYCPNTAATKWKMNYTARIEDVKTKVDTTKKHIQINDNDDLTDPMTYIGSIDRDEKLIKTFQNKDVVKQHNRYKYKNC